METVYAIAGLIAILSIVQSVFGMGILVFGTPTLLLLGVDFADVLGWLLPSSLAISALQVAGGLRQRAPDARRVRFALVGIPLLTMLCCILLLNVKASVDIWIGLAMLSAATMRQWAWLRNKFALLLASHERSYLVCMGIVHGATNMGGALLALYASSTSTNKDATRQLIAKYYLLFGIVQMSALFAFHRSAITTAGLSLALLSATIYIALGRLVFARSRPLVYDRAFTAFIAAYGIAVLAKGYL